MATSRNRYDKSIEQVMTTEERFALIRFNKEIARHSMGWMGTANCRKLALKALGEDIQYLAMAFIHLWPHWFLNGRRELAIGTEAQCREVCSDILDKLEAGGSVVSRFTYIEELFAASGMPILTGRRPLATTYELDVVKRPFRYRNVMCRYHTDKKAVSRGLCVRCYSRWDMLDKQGVYLGTFPEEAIKEFLLQPPKKRRPLVPLALAIKEKYAENS